MFQMKRTWTRENRLDSVLILALLLAVALTPLVSFGQQCEQLHSEVLRLHILANSDSTEDQRVKLAVRDAVLAGTGELFGSVLTLAQAQTLAGESLGEIEQIARDELARQGYAAPVHAELSESYFGTRVYQNATLPAGRYSALRITIGSGQGRNWWCVMFPPLCVESAAKETEDPEKSELQQKVEGLDERPDYKLAFASVELVESLRELLRESPANP